MQLAKAPRARFASGAWLPVVFICTLSPCLAQDLKFIRGDCNGDGQVSGVVTDAVFMLGFNFLGGVAPACFDACDADDDGQFRGSVTDAVYLLNFNFLGGMPPVTPYPNCGVDETKDNLTCDVYSLCTDCFSQADLDQAIAENVPPVVCIPPDQPFDFQNLHIVLCPADLAPPCGEPPAPGCPVNFTTVLGTIDISNPADAKVRIHIEGGIDDLPVRVENTLFMTSEVCTNDVTFSGDAVVPVVLEEVGPGEYTILVIGQPVFDRGTTDVRLTSSPEVLLCNLFESLQDFFVEELLTQLEAQADSLLTDLRTELVGQLVCTP